MTRQNWLKQGIWLSLQVDCLLLVLQKWHGIITLETRKLSTLKDLHKLMLKMLLLSLKMYLDSVLSVLQQRRARARDSDVGRRLAYLEISLMVLCFFTCSVVYTRSAVSNYALKTYNSGHCHSEIDSNIHISIASSALQSAATPQNFSG